MKFVCVKCGHIEEKEPAALCSRCGGILRYEQDNVCKRYIDEIMPNVLRYRPLLPVEGKEAVSLCEGNTPLADLNEYAQSWGLKRLLVKCEFMNPTASFKDRAMAVSFTRAKELGVKKIIVASAGNASSSAAAYGARAGIDVYAIVPESCTKNKILQALAYGAKVIKTPGQYSESHKLVEDFCKANGMFNVTTTYSNPYNTAGYKTMGYEIYEQLGGSPDWIMVPVGAGPLLAGLYDAFADLNRVLGNVKMPRLVACQVDRCDPIAKAYRERLHCVEAFEMKKGTIASGLNDELKGYTQDGDYTLSCVYNSNGYAMSISEEEVVEATMRMSQSGFYIEPASATGLLVTKRMRAQDIIKKNETVVMIATGSGLKNPIAEFDFKPVTVTDIKELERIVL